MIFKSPRSLLRTYVFKLNYRTSESWEIENIFHHERWHVWPVIFGININYIMKKKSSSSTPSRGLKSVLLPASSNKLLFVVSHCRRWAQLLKSIVAFFFLSSYLSSLLPLSLPCLLHRPCPPPPTRIYVRSLKTWEFHAISMGSVFSPIIFFFSFRVDNRTKGERQVLGWVNTKLIVLRRKSSIMVFSSKDGSVMIEPGKERASVLP